MRSVVVKQADALSPVEAGPAPMLGWLKIADLVIDDSYQRELRPSNWAAIKKIASAFTWSRFSPVFVAPVEGGKFAIIDGQHRTHAAALCGFSEVPAQIVQMSAAEQADAFAAVNGLVTKITSVQLFKAALASGAGWAVRLADIAKKGGCVVKTSNGSTLAKKPGEIYAVSAFRAAVEKYSDGVVPALMALRSLPGWGDDAAYWDAHVFIPVLKALCQRPKAVDRPDFCSGFSELDIWSEVDRSKAEKVARARSGQPSVSAKELLESQIVDFISRRFPERVAIPEKLSRTEILARVGKIGGAP